jgi:ABC-type methionine transport system ATPase subunit
VGPRQGLHLSLLIGGQHEVTLAQGPAIPTTVVQVEDAGGLGGEVGVFLSSHLLDEVEKTCEQVAIIDGGRILMQGTVADIAVRQALFSQAFDRLIPHALFTDQGSPLLIQSVTVAVVVLLGWTALALGAGGWRTATRDA